MSIAQAEMKEPTSTAEMVNPFNSKYEMSDEDMAKVFAQNGDSGVPDEKEQLGIVNDAALSASEMQDELIREYLLAVLSSRRSSIHHFIVDAAGYILNDNSIAHEDAVQVLKTVTKFFQEKYVRQ